MRWLASNTFKLAYRNWGEKSMGRVIDLVYDEFVALQADGSLLHDGHILGLAARVAGV
jgi:hypothetical protein